MAQTTCVLPVYNDSNEWLTLSNLIINDCGITQNNSQFLTLYRALPLELQQRYNVHLTTNSPTSYQDLIRDLKIRQENASTDSLEKLIQIDPMGPEGPKEYLRIMKQRFNKVNLVLNNEQIKKLFIKGLPMQLKA